MLWELYYFWLFHIEFLFHIDCNKASCGYGKKSLVKGSIPSTFKFKQEPKEKRKTEEEKPKTNKTNAKTDEKQ